MTKKTRKTHKMRKVLLTVCCAALLVCVTIGATVAYLTSTKTVTNTFTVGNVNIKLDETKVDENGDPVDANGDPIAEDATPIRAEQGNAYHLLPGHTYTKDPKVTVLKGSEDCHVRVLVTINEQKDLDEIFAPGVNLDNILTGRDAAKWVVKQITKDAVKDTRTYELRYAEKILATDCANADEVLPAVFTKIEMPEDINGDDLAQLGNSLKIEVVAQAIQADGFEDADAAWEAFDKQA